VSATTSRLAAIALAALGTWSCATSRVAAHSGTHDSLIGAWRLAALEEQGPNGEVRAADSTGLLVFTPDGHMSVQVMSRIALSDTPYAQGGYEASFGRYDLDEVAHRFVFHVDGALVRSLIGKHLARAFELSGGRLIVRSTNPVERWRVVWEREPAPGPRDLEMVAPALERYRQGPLAELWKRAGLSARDRSLVTVAALIARNQTVEMPEQFDLALQNGVRPSELSEVITHLAFYSGWANVMSAAAIAKDIFHKRGIGADQLPPASGELLPIDEAAEAQRASRVEQDAGSVAPGVVQYTRDLLFRELWLRPALAPRDRSLVTVSALVASGQVAQVTYHLNRAMESGLTKAEASEVLTQLAFYAGWPNVFSAIPVAKAVFENRGQR